MDKILRKVIATGVLLVIFFITVVAASYAWITYSTAPIVQGVQVSLAGTSTILLAPNQTKIVDGNIYHYPGRFSQYLYFNDYEQYDYLNAIDGLYPVSTADGLHWFLPTYYGAGDKEVIDGMAVAGALRPFEDFYLDTTLEYSNLIEPKSALRGSYVWLDFWVVSPNVDYYLRIAQGGQNDGSYVIELMQPTKNGDGEYELAETLGSVAASTRIGFLVNSDTVIDDSMMHYVESGYCPSGYTSLRGNYQEMGEQVPRFIEYDFTIYEPNADLHPYGIDGSYNATIPVAWGEDGVYLADIRDNLTVQLTNNWYEGDNGKYFIQEAFQTATFGKTYTSLSSVSTDFYQRYLQSNLAAYVEKGEFVTNTSALYDAMTAGKVSQDKMKTLELSGATEDVVLVHLEKNVPQRIRMFVWIEGQDSDCIRSLSNISFAIGLELAGSKVDDKTE